MSDSFNQTMDTAGAERVLNVRNDVPDIRDRYYEPALIRLENSIDNRDPALVLDQGQEGACTGFGLAAVINLLNVKRNRADFRASTRMLYEMARKHDEWPGEDYAGSSCRGAIRGWKNMGVCPDGKPRDAARHPEQWAYVTDDMLGGLTIARARAARVNTPGAYYRLRPEVSDYHAAINETGAIYVSARVTQGWSTLGRSRFTSLPEIPFSDQRIGGHAFAIVGYNDKGFIVQNSWGKRWGHKGFGIWSYEDWVENIMDGWAFRLALPTPSIFGHVPRSAVTGGVEAQRRAPKRFEIAGHFVHVDDGHYKERGTYWSTAEDVENTAKLIAEAEHFKHLLIYAHGGLNAPRASARRIHALKEGFKRNGIYPFHIMYDTGLAEEVKDTVRRALRLAEQRSEGFLDRLKKKVTEFTDELIEDAVRRPVTAIWDEMKRDAEVPFVGKGDGLHTIQTFAQSLAGTDKQFHLAGHSTGAVLLGHLLDALDALGVENLISSCNLMAPACTVEFYHQRYHPRLGKAATGGKVVRLPKLAIYRLSEQLELDDNVAFAYRKSLLYLITKALERQRDKPILGLERDDKKIKKGSGLKMITAKSAKSGVSTSTTHGGFDNDHNTLNDIMKRVLSTNKLPHPFTKSEMEGY